MLSREVEEDHELISILGQALSGLRKLRFVSFDEQIESP